MVEADDGLFTAEERVQMIGDAFVIWFRYVTQCRARAYDFFDHDDPAGSDLETIADWRIVVGAPMRELMAINVHPWNPNGCMKPTSLHGRGYGLPAIFFSER